MQFAVGSKLEVTANHLLPTKSKQLAIGRELKSTANHLLHTAH